MLWRLLHYVGEGPFSRVGTAGTRETWSTVVAALELPWRLSLSSRVTQLHIALQFNMISTRSLAEPPFLSQLLVRFSVYVYVLQCSGVKHGIK